MPTSNSSPPTATCLGARKLGRPDGPPGSVIYTGPGEPNLRVVDVLATENDDPEMKSFTDFRASREPLR